MELKNVQNNQGVVQSGTISETQRIRLEEIAKLIVAPGKGLLAADESLPTIGKRFDKLGLPSTDFTRNAYRETLFASEGFEKGISGVIFFKEQLAADSYGGNTLRSYLANKNVLIGVKVDEGLADFNEVEKVTKKAGLDDLFARLITYKELGAVFTKWRAAIAIQGNDYPTEECIYENAKLLASYAQISQQAGLTPIVEPEVLMDGEHTITRCFEVTKNTLPVVFKELDKKGIYLPGMILKPNMVVSGKTCPEQASPEEVAKMTLSCLEATLPPEVPGVTFLSGGQTTDQAISNLNAINKYRAEHRKVDPDSYPWNMSFSFGRGLQDEAMKAFAEGIKEAQRVFLERALQTGQATLGALGESK